MTCPEIMKKSKRKLFAYIHSHVKDQVMGVTIDGKTGATIQAVILPTKQRVMLGLGIGDDKAHAHHTYRGIYGEDRYTLEWSDDPETDERLADLRERLAESARKLHEPASELPKRASEPSQSLDKESSEPLEDTGQITTDLMRKGLEAAKATRKLSKQQVAGDTDAEPRDESPTDKSHGGFF